MKKAAVTGGAGFIGSNLVDKLIQQGVEVTIIDDFSTGFRSNLNPQAKLYEGSIHNTPTSILANVLKDCDVVFHTAALARVQPSIKDPLKFNEVNVTGTLNLLKACVDAGVKRVVYSASSSAYGNTTTFPTPETSTTNPLSPYGLQKFIGEQYCKMFSEVYKLDTASLRYFNIYGERMSLEGAYKLAIPIFANQMLEGKPLTINNDGEQRRDFTYVGDAVNANILAATYQEPLNGEVFNIGNGKNYSINELANMMGGEKSYGNKVIEPFETLANNTKAKEILKWDPKGDLETWIQNYKKEIGI